MLPLDLFHQSPWGDGAGECGCEKYSCPRVMNLSPFRAAAPYSGHVPIQRVEKALGVPSPPAQILRPRGSQMDEAVVPSGPRAARGLSRKAPDFSSTSLLPPLRPPRIPRNPFLPRSPPFLTPLAPGASELASHMEWIILDPR